MDDNLVYIDTNFLVYLQNKKSPFYKSSKAIFEKYIFENSLLTNQLVIYEFFSIMTDSRKIEKYWSPEKAKQYIETLINILNYIHPMDNEIFNEVLLTVDKYNIKRYNIFDHIIACSMKKYKITKIITANKDDFIKYDFIKDIIVPEKVD